MVFKDPNLSLDLDLNTYKEDATRSILHVIERESFSRNGGYSPIYRVYSELGLRVK